MTALDGRWARWRRFAIGAAAACATGACGLSTAQHEQIHTWMVCTECDSALRAQVIALDGRAVPTFRQYLLDGPPADRRENMRRKAGSAYALIQAQAPGDRWDSLAQRQSAAAFTQRSVDTYVTLVRSRSAVALGIIGGPASVAALESVLTRADTLPPVLAQAARAALAQAADTTRLRSGHAVPRPH